MESNFFESFLFVLGVVAIVFVYNKIEDKIARNKERAKKFRIRSGKDSNFKQDPK